MRGEEGMHNHRATHFLIMCDKFFPLVLMSWSSLKIIGILCMCVRMYICVVQWNT